MTKLEGRMDRICRARIEEIDWDKHWQGFIKWGRIGGKWRQETKMLQKEGIGEYLSAPQVDDFEGWK